LASDTTDAARGSALWRPDGSARGANSFVGCGGDTVNSPFVRNLFLLVSICLYLTSLFFEAIPGTRGITVLLMGWMEFFAFKTVGPFVAFAWLANPLLLLVLALDSFPIKPLRYWRSFWRPWQSFSVSDMSFSVHRS
jgi:hypothetical protein